MTTTVNINIQNNCGCCGGSSTAPAGGIIDIPTPGAPQGPPPGFGEATSLANRQCRTAVFLYSWLESNTDFLANNSLGQSLLNIVETSSVPENVIKLLAAAIGGILGSLATAGLDISDVVIGPVSAYLAYAVVGQLVRVLRTNAVTIPAAQDVVSKLPTVKDQIICALSKATDGPSAYTAFEKSLDTLNLSNSQKSFLAASMPPELIALLYYSADWWPSFDTETLVSITPNCCGSFIDGTPLLPSSTEGCQSAWYIVDKLVQTLNGVHSYYSAYFWPGGDGAPAIIPVWSDPIEEFYKATEQELPGYVPAKVLEKAANKQVFFLAVSQYIRNQVYLFPSNPLVYLDYNWRNLATYLASQAGTIRTDLRAAVDLIDCYTAVYDPLATWIDANVTDTDLATYMKNALNGLINPAAGHEGLLNLMFVQDADLAFYASTDCAGGGDPAGDYDPVDCTDTGIYDFTAAQYNWVLGANGSWAANVGFWFDTSGVKTAEIVQQVKHSPASIKLTWNANESGRPIYVYVSDNGTDWTEHTHLDFQPTGEITFGGCIVGKYIKIVIFVWQASWVQISKVEFA